VKALAVVDWDELYETYETRRLKNLTWVKIPVKQDGLGYGLMVLGDDGPLAYAGFVAILLVAAKCKRRGLLIRDDGKPHTIETLAVKTKLPTEVLRLAVERAVSSDVAWLAWVEIEEKSVSPADHPQISANSSRSPADPPQKTEKSSRPHVDFSLEEIRKDNRRILPPTPLSGGFGVGDPDEEIPDGPPTATTRGPAPTVIDRDTGWDQIQDAWSLVCQTHPSDEDWREALLPWRRLSFEERSCATKRLNELFETGDDDPIRKSLPVNYLRKKMWTRIRSSNGARAPTKATGYDVLQAMIRDGEEVTQEGTR
jgi:hypothetical protein